MTIKTYMHYNIVVHGFVSIKRLLQNVNLISIDADAQLGSTSDEYEEVCSIALLTTNEQVERH